jgi:predicted metal-dependent phosphoesterase TrpH
VIGGAGGRGARFPISSSVSVRHGAASPSAGSFRIDLHNHTRYSCDGSLSPLGLLRRARDRGIHCLAVTDHETLEGAEACAALAAADPTLPRVIPGVEVCTEVGEVIGLFIEREVSAGLPLAQTVEAIRAQGGLVYLPHPFDTLRRGAIRPEAREAAASLADIVEVVNGRSLRADHERQACLLAGRLGKAPGAGSDAHYPGEVGRRYMEVPWLPTRSDLVKVLGLGCCVPEPGRGRYLAAWVYVARSAAVKVIRNAMPGR